jgi:hypothetical protein
MNTTDKPAFIEDAHHLTRYLFDVWRMVNKPNEERDWLYHASLEDFRFDRFAAAINRNLRELATHPRSDAVEALTRQAVEMIKRGIHTAQPLDPFVAVLQDLETALLNQNQS